MQTSLREGFKQKIRFRDSGLPSSLTLIYYVKISSSFLNKESNIWLIQKGGKIRFTKFYDKILV